jgi:hypothetical protein
MSNYTVLKTYRMKYDKYTFYYSNGVKSDFKDGIMGHDYHLIDGQEYYCLVDLISRLVLIIIPVSEVSTTSSN